MINEELEDMSGEQKKGAVDPYGEMRENMVNNLIKIQKRADAIAKKAGAKSLKFPSVPVESSIDLTDPHINN